MTRRANPAQATLFDTPAIDTPETPAGGFTPLAEQFEALPTDWKALLAPCLAQTPWPELCAFVDGERAAGKPIFPTDVFRALHLTSVDDVRVVILGQDPYHGDDRGTPQAHGLAFSVPPAVRPPPSLRNIFKEMQRDLGQPFPPLPDPGGSLVSWARNGVLLLNTCLTVEEGQAASHSGRGWERLTDAVIRHVAEGARPVVFMLWGGHAQGKRALIPADRGHLVLTSNHPSPLSALRPPAPFIGNGHFGQARAFRERQGA